MTWASKNVLTCIYQKNKIEPPKLEKKILLWHVDLIFLFIYKTHVFFVLLQIHEQIWLNLFSFYYAGTTSRNNNTNLILFIPLHFPFWNINRKNVNKLSHSFYSIYHISRDHISYKLFIDIWIYDENSFFCLFANLK
jgi:hypothetical protein